MCQEETRESTKSSPGIKGLGERVIAQRQVDRTLKVLPRPSSSKKPLLTWLLPLLHTWSYLFRDYLPLRLVSSVRAGMGSIGLAIDKRVPKVGSWLYVYVCVLCVSEWVQRRCMYHQLSCIHALSPFLENTVAFPPPSLCPQYSILFREIICSTCDDNLLISKEVTTKQW